MVVTTRSQKRKLNGVSPDQKNGKSRLNEVELKPERKKGESYGSFRADVFHYYIGPLFVILTMPTFFLMIHYVNKNFEGSVYDFLQSLREVGLLTGFYQMWTSVSHCNPLAIGIVLGFAAFMVTIHTLIPAPIVTGTQTPTGHIPEYKDNGFRCYAVAMTTLAVLTYVLKTNYGISTTVVYDIFGDIVGFLWWFGALVSALLYIKGHIAPSGADRCITGYPVYDFYVGTELYPRVFGVDVKVFTNCRFGMTAWPILVCLYTLKSYELHGFVDSIWVSSILYMAYITKFFWWEAGYYRSIDIILDGAGYMICWGCISAIPSLYASVTFYFVSHPVRLGPILSSLILAAGLVSLGLNYLADLQRQKVRSTNGKCTIMGRKPEYIRAKYTLQSGKTSDSILLTSGLWGIARHFNYIPELTLAFSWTVPALFNHLLPYSYLIFLVILLTHRASRDEEKCSIKYGRYWQEYKKIVPYKMLPGIY